MAKVQQETWMVRTNLKAIFLQPFLGAYDSRCSVFITLYLFFHMFSIQGDYKQKTSKSITSKTFTLSFLTNRHFTKAKWFQTSSLAQINMCSPYTDPECSTKNLLQWSLVASFLEFWGGKKFGAWPNWREAHHHSFLPSLKYHRQILHGTG